MSGKKKRYKKSKMFFNTVFKWLCKQFTFQKMIVIWLVWKGISWVDQSYALAWAGKNEIAQVLSQTALIELLGVTLVYSLKALFENLSKNNDWPDKRKAEDVIMPNDSQNGGDPPAVG